MPTIKKMPKENEYFKVISEKVAEKRMKGEYSAEEMRIYREGKVDALRSLCVEIFPNNADMYGQKYAYNETELHNFIMLEFKNMRNRIEKAKRIFRIQTKQLETLRIVSMFDGGDE